MLDFYGQFHCFPTYCSEGPWTLGAWTQIPSISFWCRFRLSAWSILWGEIERGWMSSAAGTTIALDRSISVTQSLKLWLKGLVSYWEFIATSRWKSARKGAKMHLIRQTYSQRFKLCPRLLFRLLRFPGRPKIKVRRTFCVRSFPSVRLIWPPAANVPWWQKNLTFSPRSRIIFNLIAGYAPSDSTSLRRMSVWLPLLKSQHYTAEKSAGVRPECVIQLI